MLDHDKLKNIDSPIRYVGGEANSVQKDPQKVNCRIAYGVPSTYELGMIDFDMNSVYYLINKEKDMWCERVFAPMPDFEKLLREQNHLIYTLESKTPLKKMDLVIFSVTHELVYTNILNMLNLGGIPILEARRKDDFPYIIGALNGVCNPRPLEKFFDIFVIGEISEVVKELGTKYIQWKQQKTNKNDYYELIKDIPGIYIPKIHGSETKIQMVIDTSENIEKFAKKPVVPSTAGVLNGNIVRLTKGCSRGCKSCIYKYAYGKVYEKDINVALENVRDITQQTGDANVILMSNCFLEYAGFPEIIYAIQDLDRPKVKSISFLDIKLNKNNLWSLKYMTNKEDYPSIIVGGANKNIREKLGIEIEDSEIFEIAREVFKNDFTKLRLKYIIGSPRENYEDLTNILKLAEDITKVYFEVYSKMPDKYIVEVNLYNFSPKAGTPMQWAPANSSEKLQLKARYLMDKNKNNNITFNIMQPERSTLETILSRGDEMVGNLIYEAFKQGARHDSIPNIFNYQPWQIAMTKLDFDVKRYLEEIDIDKKLDWDNICFGTTKEKLQEEYITVSGGKNENSRNK